MKRFYVCILVAVFGITLVGCGTAARKAVEEGTERRIEKETGKDVELDTGKDSVRIESEEGTFEAGEEVELPKNWPRDIPVYSPSRIIAAWSMAENDALALTILADAPLDTVKAFYEEVFSKPPLNISSTMTNPDGALFVASKNDVEYCTAAITAGDDGTNVQITVTLK